MSSFTSFSLMTIASSKLWPYQGMKATRAFRPRASDPPSVPGPSAMTSPASTFWPTRTMGRWLMAVSWFVRQNFRRR